MRQLLYVAHPVAPTADELTGAFRWNSGIRHPASAEEITPFVVKKNIDRAMQWLSWLRRSFPETTFIAPWIASIMAGEDDSDPKAGLVDCCAVVERCDGIVLVGDRISSGMRREMEHKWGTTAEGGPFESAVYDLTWWCGSEGTPLTCGEIGPPFGEWYLRNDMGRGLG